MTPFPGSCSHLAFCFHHERGYQRGFCFPHGSLHDFCSLLDRLRGFCFLHGSLHDSCSLLDRLRGFCFLLEFCCRRGLCRHHEDGSESDSWLHNAFGFEIEAGIQLLGVMG
jgi:hypothetical protein